MLASVADKHHQLQQSRSPKMILTGGSNVTFGVDSKTISDSLHMPVVNTAIHGGLGLAYMANNIIPYIKKGDCVVLIPEYENFYTNNFYGEMELVSLLFDVDKGERKWIGSLQWTYLLKYCIPYAAKKIGNTMWEKIQKNKDPNVPDIYSRNSFNEYGDAYIHWSLPDLSFNPIKKENNACVKQPVLNFIKDYKKRVEQKKATLIILPPVMESNSFDQLADIIEEIDSLLKKNGTPYACDPHRYRLPASYFFNTYYHTNKLGVDLRTKLLIENLQEVVKK